MIRKALLGALGSLGLIGTAAAAGSATDSFDVTAQVIGVCTFDSGIADIDFGSYTGATITRSSTVAVTCTNGAPYTIALDAGANGTFATRAMASGGNLLNYNLYTENSYTTIWGDGTSSTSTMGATGDGDTDSYTIYANMPASQSLIVGSYSDTVTATVSY